MNTQGLEVKYTFLKISRFVYQGDTGLSFAPVPSQCGGAILFAQAEFASWPAGPVWLFRPRYPSFPRCTAECCCAAPER
ncbi:MAG: hypothetical protein AVDCRST_MAG95-878 [uncultured Adhaeribacter sp.]|uniref:Uncharacterized protein n=1 Tax=uncultured Adhaeribacter sp. TaxID=448109 RepID=A0A6J4HLR2_9BACT|nr:MAG: hypothetical protein AVDCRST_MAG95-878 [uncultured Adhaeribacter sp.]